ncbi:MAG: amino acid ABC transporter permease, partial [Mesorhizobium sp.]
MTATTSTAKSEFPWWLAAAAVLALAAALA